MELRKLGQETRNLSAILLMAIIGAGPAAAEISKCEVSLSSNLALDKSSFTPVNMSFTPTLRLGREYIGTLVRYDATAKIVPSLAKSWEIASDNRSITFHLNPSCKWSDGASITAAQFVAGFQSIFDPSTSFTGNSGFALYSETIKGASEIRKGELSRDQLGVSALDEQTFVVETTGPADLFLESLVRQNYTPLPTHWIETGKMKWPAPDLWRVASGAYVVDEISPKQLIFKKNPYYCPEQQISFKKVKYVLDSPRQATVGMFLNGEIDGIDRYSRRIVAPLLKNPAELRKFKLTAPKGTPDRVYTYLYVNQTIPELADPRIKQAISLLVEYEFLASEPMMGSTTRVLPGLTLPGNGYEGPAFESRLIPYSDRVEMARALMAEAGYSETNRLVLDLPLRENHELYSMGQAIAGMLSRGYFDVKARKAGEGEAYYKNLDDRTFGVGLLLWGTVISDQSSVLRGIIDKRVTDVETYEQYHALFQESLKQDSREERLGKLLELETLLRDSGHIIPLTVVTRTFIVSDELKLGDGIFLQAYLLKPADEKVCQP